MEKKILIIEDEPAIIEITTIALQDAGYKVFSTIDPDKIYHYIKGLQPDLILLDINLWGLNGRIICQYIKGYEALSHIPVLVMSANNDIEQIAKECRADGLIKKPFDLGHLLNLVAQHLKVS